MSDGTQRYCFECHRSTDMGSAASHCSPTNTRRNTPNEISKSFTDLYGVILVLAVALVGVLLFVKNQPAPTRGIQPLVEIAEMEPDSSQWGLNFPNQYSTCC